MTREEGRARVADLVARFAANQRYYESPDFDEESTKQNFVTPFFEALGWDVTDRAGRGPAREVILETRLYDDPEVAGEEDWDQDLTPEELAERQPRLRFPDYGFRLDLRYRMFAEAKKPSVRVTSRGPAFQVKSYAWSEQLPVSIVTNFAEFVTFDCTRRPSYVDALAGRMDDFSFSYLDYVERWDRIWEHFSRDNVATGSLDQAVRGGYRRRGDVAVDRAFLEDLAEWRQLLATDLEARNPGLDRHALAEATQRILDRVVFLRVCEDRLIEPAPLLRRFARREDSYHRLAREFRRLDTVYNGQLFRAHFSEDLELSDSVFQRLIASLYPPFSPYRFDVIGADLLGAVYERFLGQTIEVSDGGEVTLEDKPEVRHAGGVYYTPRWVVDRIVQAALAPHVEGKGPAAVRNVRILDPACGSGSFLLGALDYLVQYLERYYTEQPSTEPGKHVAAPDGTRLLTREAKAELLTNCIFGVDIDPQAVEVTQMSLYLKILEGETADPRLFHAGALLPPMQGNIRCGNTLLSTEDVPAPNLLDDELDRRINPFDWESERDGFGAVLGAGGFHAIIGNPPYTRVQVMRQYRPEESDLYARRYESASVGSWDIAGLFVERCLPYLRRRRDAAGRLAFIISRQFCEADFGRPLRELLASRRSVREIIDFRSGFVFEGVSAYTLILVTSATPSDTVRLTRVSPPPSPANLALAENPASGLSADVHASTLTADDWDLLLPSEASFLERLQAEHVDLGEATHGSIFQGVVTGADVHVFRLLDEGPDRNDPSLRRVRSAGGGDIFAIEQRLLRPVYRGRSDIIRFLTKPSSEFVLLPYSRSTDDEPYALIRPDDMQREFPLALGWLERNQERLRARAGNWSDLDWYGYSRRQNLEAFEKPKIMVPYMVEYLCAQWDEDGHFFVNVSTGGYGLVPTGDWQPAFIEALLNSRLLSWLLRRRSRAFAHDWFAARKGNLERLPIVRVDRLAQDQVVQLMGRCRDLRVAQEEARTDDDRDRRGRFLRAGIETFDAAVEGLYGVTDQERSLLRD